MNAIEERLPEDIYAILQEALPCLQVGRPGDVEHVYDLLDEIMKYTSADFVLDLSILLPAAILHDIGHCAILPEHFVYLTGANKIKNAKLVHMLTGAKITRDILEKVGYPQEKTKEIVAIVAVHDADQIEGMGLQVYDTLNKKLFHDFDRIGMFNLERMEKYLSIGENRAKKDKLRTEILNAIETIFYDELKVYAKKKWENGVRALFEDV